MLEDTRRMAVVVLVAVVIVFVAGLVGGQNPKCNDIDLRKCMHDLQALTSNQDLAFAHTEEELNIVCGHLQQALSCVNRFTGRCFNRSQQEAYNTMTKGAQELLFDLCTNSSDFRRRYLKHAPCYRQLADEYKHCSEQYLKEQDSIKHQNLDLDAQLRLSCCLLDGYKHCTRSAVLGKCNPEAADLSEQIVVKVGGPLIHKRCADYRHDSPHCSAGVVWTQSLFLLLLAVAAGTMVFF